MYVDVRDKEQRLKFIESLEQEGYTFDEDGIKDKEWVANSVLPLIISYKNKTIDRIEDVKSVAPLIKKKQLLSIEKYYDEFCPWYEIDEELIGYTKEELRDYFGEWERNPKVKMDLSQDRGEPDFDEDDYGVTASNWARRDFANHNKKMELKDFPNRNEYANYLRSLRFCVRMICSGFDRFI